ncbi:protein LURP-one-related 10-like [Malus sylvestris]|uniref:protein LURP-one-related 10-like n=1 Tax=Malus sylvestris TaxID=3752 RepID=UPI0021AC964B|nr:protein LURP-one-related 10-like [Malus sylvestris]
MIMKQAEPSAPSLASANPDPGSAAHANPTAPIVSPHFCSPNPVVIEIVRKVRTITGDKFVVTDVNGNMIFKVKEAHFSFHDHRVLLDAAGHPIITLRRKFNTAHERWQVFRGDSKDSRDLIFSAKRSSMFQLKAKLDVFLAQNITENVPDFKVKGNWSERSCVIHAGDSSTMLAQMHKKHTVTPVSFGKNNFTVTVYSGIDYAFIVALIAIFCEINTPSSSGSSVGVTDLHGFTTS